jgi:hypothetical protein
VGIVTALFLGVVWVACDALSASTMELLAQSEQTSRNIEAQRSIGADLEVKYSVASNPQLIQEGAAALGMAPDPQVDYLSVSIGE